MRQQLTMDKESISAMPESPDKDGKLAVEEADVAAMDKQVADLKAYGDVRKSKIVAKVKGVSAAFAANGGKVPVAVLDEWSWDDLWSMSQVKEEELNSMRQELTLQNSNISTMADGPDKNGKLAKLAVEEADVAAMDKQVADLKAYGHLKVVAHLKEDVTILSPTPTLTLTLTLTLPLRDCPSG